MYVINDGTIFLEKSGQEIARIDSGGGLTMISQAKKHQEELPKWLESHGIHAVLPEDTPEEPAAEAAAVQSPAVQSPAALPSVPLLDGPLEAPVRPPWNPALGMMTPGLKEYIEANGMDAAAVTQMVRKLERGEHV
jgi:hypothetical protein